MSANLWNPEITRDGLKAVAFTQHSVDIFDLTADPEREVFSCETLEDAQKFMDVVNPYLAAFQAHAAYETPETEAAMSKSYEAIPDRRWRGAAITIAFRRCE
jgi:hypothetical protein